MSTAAELAHLAATLAQLAERLAAREEEAERPAAKPMPPRVLFTVEEAAKLLGIGRTTTWGLVDSEELQSVRIGRSRRVHIDAINDYAAQLVAKSMNKNAA